MRFSFQFHGPLLWDGKLFCSLPKGLVFRGSKCWVPHLLSTINERSGLARVSDECALFHSSGRDIPGISFFFHRQLSKRIYWLLLGIPSTRSIGKRIETAARVFRRISPCELWIRSALGFLSVCVCVFVCVCVCSPFLRYPPSDGVTDLEIPTPAHSARSFAADEKSKTAPRRVHALFAAPAPIETQGNRIAHHVKLFFPFQDEKKKHAHTPTQETR